jgi:hypothetical protein
MGMNKYGYRVDITHPFVEPLYRAYRQRIGNYRYPLSDKERLDFEREFLSKYPDKMPECECYDWDRKNGYHK